MFYVIYIFVPIIILALFDHLAPRKALMSVPICIVFDLVFFWNDFSYYEARPLAIIFTIIQTVVVIIFALNIRGKNIR